MTIEKQSMLTGNKGYCILLYCIQNPLLRVNLLSDVGIKGCCCLQLLQTHLTKKSNVFYQYWQQVFMRKWHMLMLAVRFRSYMKVLKGIWETVLYRPNKSWKCCSAVAYRGGWGLKSPWPSTENLFIVFSCIFLYFWMWFLGLNPPFWTVHWGLFCLSACLEYKK